MCLTSNIFNHHNVKTIQKVTSYYIIQVVKAETFVLFLYYQVIKIYSAFNFCCLLFRRNKKYLLKIKLIQFIFNLFQIRTWQVTKSENKIFLKQYPIKATLGQAYDEEWTRPSGKDALLLVAIPTIVGGSCLVPYDPPVKMYKNIYITSTKY